MDWDVQYIHRTVLYFKLLKTTPTIVKKQVQSAASTTKHPRCFTLTHQPQGWNKQKVQRVLAEWTGNPS